MNLTLQKIINLPKAVKISILPHDNLDVDAILSSILLSQILDYLKIDNEIIVFDKKTARDTNYICKLVGVDISSYIVDEEDSSRNLFLIDHFSTSHKGSVIGCIDHHPTNQNINCDIYEYRASCATAYIIYSFMLEINMEVTKEMFEMITYAMLVDTCSFTSSKTVKKEAEILPSIVSSYGLDFKKMKERAYLYTDIENMSIEEIITNGLKEYHFKRGTVKASYIQSKNNVNEDLFAEISSEIRKRVLDENLLLWVFISYALEEKKTYLHLISALDVESKKYDRI